MTNTSRKTMRRAPFVVALFVALGVATAPSPALGGLGGSAPQCPQQVGGPCDKIGKRPAKAPKQVRPTIRPAQVQGPYGGPVWRSGPWLMS